jgi:hypothetical protein
MAEKHYKWTVSAVLGFLIDIGKGWKNDKITYKTAQDVLRAVLEDLIPSIRLTAPHSETGKRIRISDSSYLIASAFVDSEQIIELLRQCVCLDLGPQVHQLFNKLERLASDEEPAIAFKGFFLPFAKELHGMPAEENPSALAQEVHNVGRLFVVKLLDLYSSRCVGPKPSPPTDWQRTKCGCGCMECLQLDSFLVDPAQEETVISASSEDRVRHLQQQLPLVYQSRYEAARPEHETEIRRTALGFELSIRKTQSAWTSAVKRWVEDRDAAERELGRVFNGGNGALPKLGGEQMADSAISMLLGCRDGGV